VSEVEGLLFGTLERAQGLGYVGPGPIDPHIEHASAFGRAIEQFLGLIPASVADLGSGGGLPALVLAARWPETRFALVEGMARRARFLRRAVAELQWNERVAVVEARGEDAAHDPQFRAAFAVVTARSFAGPAATAEIGTGFLPVGGVLAVSEPPTSRDDRWPAGPLLELGLAPPEIVGDPDATAHFALLRKIGPVNDDIPRLRALSTRRPRW
jgi:16S rRNA (guanine527-N7)-methyltransferase